MNREEPLRLARRFEPSHLTLPLARWRVGDLGSFVRVSAGEVHDRWHDLPMHGGITAQLVGDESPWLSYLTFQQLAEEALRSTSVTTRLNKDVDHIAVLIDGTP